MSTRTALAVALVAAAFPTAVLANDSEAETALGGLTLKQSDSITMDSEDLYLSRDEVRVAYRFTNQSDSPVDTLVAFPLPDIPPGEDENVNYWRDPSELHFRTTIDGKPVSFEIVQQAFFKGKDVSAQLAALKIPVNRFDPKLEKALETAPREERERLIHEGLLRDEGGEADHYYVPQWSLRTSVTRRQIFPPKATVVVEHRYAPLIGGSVAGGLDASQRKTKEFDEKKQRHCIEKDWLAGFDRRVGNGASYQEIWLGYVLTTGANWKGPIGDFRLVVDKGKADSLVSFCAEGVQKISPTQFEARSKNFTPKRDLDILILDWLR